MTRWTSLVAALVTIAIAAVLPRAVRADDPVTSSVRFNKEVIRIFQRKCLSCHASDGLVMPLANYRDARAWGRAIREEIVEQRMPPWSPAPGYGRFRNDLGLTSRERLTILTWVDGGMPKGDDRDLPGPSDGADGDPGAHAPDLRVAVPPQTVPADADVVVRRVTVGTGLAADRMIERVALSPGDRRVLRGAVVYAGERWVGTWLPWQPSIAPPPGHAFRLAAGVPLTVLLYYRGLDGKEVADTSTIGLHFTDTRQAAAEVVIDATRTASAAAAPAGVRLRGEATLAAETRIWGLQPVVDESAVSLELRARRPDGSVDVLLWMPAIHHGYPHALVLQKPQIFPAGTVLTLTTHHDATSATPSARMAVGTLP